MSSVLTPPVPIKPSSGAPFRPPSWNTAGSLMSLPYLLIFVAFVIYPVLYGFWLARSPDSYVKLMNDPVFGTSIVNTALFLLIGAATLAVAFAIWRTMPKA